MMRFVCFMYGGSWLLNSILLSVLSITSDRVYSSSLNDVLCLKTERVVLTDIKQLKKPNTVYIVKQEIDLKSNVVNVPLGVTLLFRNGRIVNGTLRCNETTFLGKIALRNCTLVGTIRNDYLTPEMFGAIGDGIADDTYPLGYAIRSTCHLRVNREYRVTRPSGDNRALYAYVVPSGKIIDGGGRILMESTNALFFIHSASDIKISGLTLDFSRIGSCSSCNSSNHGIVIVNSRKITIEEIAVIATKGDGIYIGSYNDINNHNDNIRIIGSLFRDFGRQGISVIEGKGVQIIDCVFSNNELFANGGIDIEPNHDYEACDVSILQCRFMNCGINTHRDSKQLNRNNRISIKSNIVCKQRRLVGGAGSHYLGISVQDAVLAEVIDNDVSGFAGVTCYNCDSCSIKNNRISSIYRGLRVVAVDQVDISDNSVEIDDTFDFTNDRLANSAVVKDEGFTVEISSSNGSIYNNTILGCIWIRNTISFSVTNNNCRGKNGSIRLFADNPGGDSTKAVVRGNTLEAEGAGISPITVAKGSQPIVIDISYNRIKKNNQGIRYPLQVKNAYVDNNHFYD